MLSCVESMKAGKYEVQYLVSYEFTSLNPTVMSKIRSEIPDLWAVLNCKKIGYSGSLSGFLKKMTELLVSEASHHKHRTTPANAIASLFYFVDTLSLRQDFLPSYHVQEWP